MRTYTITAQEGENMGPVDWSHPTACGMPAIWRDAEKRPNRFLFNGRPIIQICMYDGWPYWTPRPAVMFMGPIGAEWNFFDGYSVYKDSIKPNLSARRSS
jgi:hypothetical protein